MADQGANVNAAGCLGRALSAIGLIWIVIVALAGLGILSESGWRGDFLSGLGPGLIPGLLFLAAGRAVTRRARSVAEAQPLPQTSTPPVIPGPRPSASPSQPAQRAPIPVAPPPVHTTPRPQPAVEKAPPEPVIESGADVARRAEETAAQRDEIEKASTEKPRPKTSQELVDEARRRWGMDKP